MHGRRIRLLTTTLLRLYRSEEFRGGLYAKSNRQRWEFKQRWNIGGEIGLPTLRLWWSVDVAPAPAAEEAELEAFCGVWSISGRERRLFCVRRLSCSLYLPPMAVCAFVWFMMGARGTGAGLGRLLVCDRRCVLMRFLGYNRTGMVGSFIGLREIGTWKGRKKKY